jgi:hypothetical protein
MSREPDLSGAAGDAPGRLLEQRRAIIDAHLELALGEVRARLESGWLDQYHSPLGQAPHVEAVRRRLRSRLDGAHTDRGRYLLTIDALVEEYFGPRAPSLERALASLGRRSPVANDNGGRQ